MEVVSPEAFPSQENTAPGNESPVPIRMLQVQKTNTGYLNVRDTPSVSGALIGKVFPGDMLSSTEERDGWFLVAVPQGGTGWVSGDYVKTTSESQP